MSLTDFNFDNSPVENEERELRTLLKDVEEGLLEYDGTTEQDLSRYELEILSEGVESDRISNKRIYDFCGKVADYYLGKVLNSEGERRLMHFRKHSRVNDLMDGIEENLLPPLSYFIFEAVKKRIDNEDQLNLGEGD